MDLENELRQAMAEHVTGVSAPRTLAQDAKRRHQRTVRRRATIAVTAAGIVVAIGVIPTYQVIHPQTVGAPGPGGRHTSHGTGASAGATAQPPAPVSGRPSVTPKESGASSRPETAPSRHPAPGHGTVPGVATSILGYLPPGINPDKTCHTEESGQRSTTICRWTGPAGWVEVRLVHDSGLNSPADMGLAPPMPKHVQVHGHRALRGDGPATLSQVMWIEHSGLGVWVGVSSDLAAHLMHVAESVHAS